MKKDLIDRTYLECETIELKNKLIYVVFLIFLH